MHLRISTAVICLCTARALAPTATRRRALQISGAAILGASTPTQALVKPSGLVVEPVGEPGRGALIKSEDYVRVDYTGYTGGFGGTEIDSAKALKGPVVKFQLGVGATTGVGGTPAKPVVVPLLPGSERARGRAGSCVFGASAACDVRPRAPQALRRRC